MRFGHLFHAVKPEIVSWHPFRWMRGAKTFLCMAAVNPGRGESDFVRREMVVKETFRRVQDLTFSVPCVTKLLDHVFKVALIGLIGTDVLRCEDVVELDLQPCITRF